MNEQNGLSPYWQGFYAPQHGVSLHGCPYPVGSGQWREWCEGWRQASGCPDNENEIENSDDDHRT
jgi:ribosome modulation factor